MDLLAYISDMGRRVELARQVRKNRVYLWQVATGRRRASTELAIEIERATAGEVTKESLRPDVWSAPASVAA